METIADDPSVYKFVRYTVSALGLVECNEQYSIELAGMKV